MLDFKPILRFLLLFILCYTGILLLALPFKDNYANLYRAMGKARFEQFGNKGIVQFFPYEDPDSKYKLNTKIVLFNVDQVVAARRSGQATVRGAEIFVSSWYSGLLPTILLLSLILASPVPWKRKILAVLIGIALTYLFILFKLRLVIAHEYLSATFLEITPTFSKWLPTAYDIFVVNIETTIIFPVFIWILVTFRKSDVKRFSLQA